MEFKQLEAFSAVAETKSFSRAAGQLYLSQSTVSSHIRNLEKELKKSLFIRSTKTVRLTPDGILFLRYVRRILDTRDAALNAISTPGETIIHLGASTIPSGYLLPQILSGYRKIHPDVYFDIDQGDSDSVLEKVCDGIVSLGIIGSRKSTPGCAFIPFCTDELVIVTPATGEYLKLRRKKPSVQTLLKEPIILREQGSGTLKSATRFLQSINISSSRLHVIARINNLESIKQMIKNGMGISILSRCVVNDMEKNGYALVYPLHTSIKRIFYLTYMKSGKLNAPLKDFIRFCQDFYAGNRE